MTRCAETRNKHSWIIDVINDLRVYCHENELRSSKDYLDQCLVAALADLAVDTGGLVDDTGATATEDSTNDMLLQLTAGRHILN